MKHYSGLHAKQVQFENFMDSSNKSLAKSSLLVFSADVVKVITTPGSMLAGLNNATMSSTQIVLGHRSEILSDNVSESRFAIVVLT